MPDASRYAIIVSEKDPVGMNVKEVMLSGGAFSKSSQEKGGESAYNGKDCMLVTIKGETIFSEDIDVNAETVIFATTHRSKDQRPIFSCHSPGNWNRADLGGREKELCFCPANVLKRAYLILKELNSGEGAPPGFGVTLECTHHGPYMEKPCIFMEVGSTEKEWHNKDAAKLLSDAILRLISEDIPKSRTAFGIGGTHYCGNFMRVDEETDIAVGHVCPKHMLLYLDKEMIIQALERTAPKADIVLLDWKGIGSEKQRIVSLLDGLGIDYAKTKDVKKGRD